VLASIFAISNLNEGNFSEFRFINNYFSNGWDDVDNSKKKGRIDVNFDFKNLKLELFTLMMSSKTFLSNFFYLNNAHGKKKHMIL